MATRKITKEGDPILRKKCREITTFDDRLSTLLDDMKETMIQNKGCGLAGPQVSMLKRVAVVFIEELDFYLELINPVIIKQKGESEEVEACLSVENYSCYVKRPEQIVLEYCDRTGKKHKKKIVGFPARACCHEIDHLDGVLFKDKCSKELTEEA